MVFKNTDGNKLIPYYFELLALIWSNQWVRTLYLMNIPWAMNGKCALLVALPLVTIEPEGSKYSIIDSFHGWGNKLTRGLYNSSLVWTPQIKSKWLKSGHLTGMDEMTLPSCFDNHSMSWKNQTVISLTFNCYYMLFIYILYFDSWRGWLIYLHSLPEVESVYRSAPRRCEQAPSPNSNCTTAVTPHRKVANFRPDRNRKPWTVPPVFFLDQFVFRKCYHIKTSVISVGLPLL